MDGSTPTPQHQSAQTLSRLDLALLPQLLDLSLYIPTMPFGDHFRKASINKGILTAECKKADGRTWFPSTINLDDYLGNNDGKFEAGLKAFSRSAADITLENGILSAKLKNKAGVLVEAKYDLGTLFHSEDGVIAKMGATCSFHRGCGTARSWSSGATVSGAAVSASAASATAASASSTSTVTSSHSSSTVSHSSSTFSSTKFRYHSQQLLLEDTCSNFVLQGSWLHCDINHEDKRVTCVNIDLDLYIGDDDGRLVWGAKGFSKTCTEIKLDGFFLVAKCHNPANHQQFIIARLDLRTRLRCQGDIIIFLEIDRQLSIMLSEVPWMKFKVIAEPDLTIFQSHPVIKQTMTLIAESTVEHVTRSMHAMLTTAMDAAIMEITASAMKHVTVLMEQSVQDAVGIACASPSMTEAGLLHIGAYGGYGHGHAHGYVPSKHEYYGGGTVNGGVWASWNISASSTYSSASSDADCSASGYTATVAKNRTHTHAVSAQS